MKKFLLVMALVLCGVGAWAQGNLPFNKACTVIAEGHSSGAKPGWAINNDKTAMVSFGNTEIAEEAQKNFAFIQFDGKVFLYSVWAEKFVNKDMSLTNTLPVDDIKVESVDGGKFFFKYDDSHNMNIGGSKQLAPDGWNTKDGGNQYTITEVDVDFDPSAALAILDNSYTITYEYMYNGKVVATQTTKITKGADYPAIDAALLPWGAVATAPAGAPAQDETKQLNCTIDSSVLPFVPAAEYNDANMKWYYLQFHADVKHYLYYTAANEVLKTDKNNYDNDDKDAYTWAFVGNPFDGYTIYNRKAGTSLTLNAAAAGAVLGNAVHKFKPTASPYGTKGFYLASEQGENKQRFNRQGGKVVYWEGADAGSTFMAIERPMGATAELQALIGDAEALLATVNANLGTAIGKYAQSTANALAAAINTAKGIGSATATDVATLQAAINAVKVILPTVGQYYQMHSALAAFSETKAVYSNGSAPRWKTLNNDDKSFYWLAVDAGNGNVVFQNANDKKYIVGNAGQSGEWTMAETPSEASYIDVRIFSETGNDIEYGIIMNNWQMHCNGHGGGTGSESNIVSWNTDNANSASSWFIKPVELQMFYDVTYNFVYNGEVKYSTTVNLAKGAAYPEVAVPALPYGVTTNAATPDGTVEGNKVFEFALTIEKELPFVTAANAASINTWYYARMHTNQPGYIGEFAEDNTINVAWGKKSDVYNENFLWGFTGDVFSGIIVVNKGTGKQLTSTGNGDVTITDNGTPFFVAHTSETSANAEYGFCLRKKDSNNFVNANYSAGKLSHWASTDAGSTMFLTKYQVNEVSVPEEGGYATLYLDHSTYIPEGVEVYAVTNFENGWIEMNPIEGFLPANTGAVLKNAGTYTFQAAAADGAVEGNLLRGSATDTYVEGSAYALSNGDYGIGFYLVTLDKDAEGAEGATHFLNNANKAYLPVSEVVFDFLGFDSGTETGIVETENGNVETGNAAIYDLSGRRVQKVQKGLYIVNGKKVIK